MSWIYLAESAHSHSPCSGYSDSSVSDTSSGIDSVSVSCSSGSQTDTSTTRPFGATSARLPSETTSADDTFDNCDESAANWLSRLASRASRSAQRERCAVKPTRATDGLVPFVSLGKSDQHGYFWKTSQLSLLGDTDISIRYSETWPRQAMMQDGVCYLRPSWAHRINVIESGLWPTPRATDAKMATTSKNSREKYSAGDSIQDRLNQMYDGNCVVNPEFREELMALPIGWTEPKPLEMRSLRLWRQRHGIC